MALSEYCHQALAFSRYDSTVRIEFFVLGNPSAEGVTACRFPAFLGS